MKLLVHKSIIPVEKVITEKPLVRTLNRKKNLSIKTHFGKGHRLCSSHYSEISLFTYKLIQMTHGYLEGEN